MKKLHKLNVAIILMAMMLPFFSCEKQENEKQEKGSVEISLTLENQDQSLKATKEDSLPPVQHHLVITVVDENGSPVLEDKVIPLYTFGSGYISNKIEMEPGAYQLTKFFVVNPDNEVIYASPKEGSSKAYLVNRPLPLSFKVAPGEVTRLVPQVLPVRNSSPDDFGYTRFGFQVVNPLPVFVMAIIDNPLLMAPTQQTEAELNVKSENGWQHRFHLEARVNKIFVPAGSSSYMFRVYNEAYGPREYKFSERQLRASTKDNPIILRFPVPIGNKIILRPGPDDGKDATITDLEPNKNLGDYPWFEASFLSEPVLTVMRNKRSLIDFNVREALPDYTRIDSVHLTLHFDVPLWDSLQNDPSGNGQEDLFLVLQQITEPWKENEVTWNNQPATIEANQVRIPYMPWMSSNRRVIDVTSLFVPVQEIAAPNYGMMLRFPGEPQWTGMKFASSDYEIAQMRPRLTVWYSYLED